MHTRCIVIAAALCGVLGLWVGAGCAARAEDMTLLNLRRHEAHEHQHGADCGHVAVRHGRHTDYLHDGHLHYVEGDAVYEHAIEESDHNPDVCKPLKEHHQHGPRCGHKTIPHGDHMDFVVEGRLHHPHGEHCDDHGPVKITTPRSGKK